MIHSKILYFTAPGSIELRAEPLPALSPDQVFVESICSAISPGSELLIYRGQFPRDLPVDETITALSGEFVYPLRYGYATVGRVIEAGVAVDPGWVNRLVFAFQPHASHFHARPEELHPLPADFDAEEAAFLPNMETAVNFLMDGKPLIGERVVVLGLGVVGLLTSALLARFPLASLIAVDPYPRRQAAALEVGVHASLPPEELDSALGVGKADLVYELSGDPAAINQALDVCAFSGRVVIGSWYGQKPAALNLGGRYHRARIRLIGSQVSTLAPEYSGRWTKARRLDVAWEMIAAVKPARFITHRFPIDQAAEAYRLLDRAPEQAIQVMLTY